MKQCDFGGAYWFFDDRQEFEPQCQRQATVFYRSPGMVQGHQGGRCAEHAKALNVTVVKIEAEK